MVVSNQFLVVYDGGGVERQTEVWVPQTGGPLCTNTALTLLFVIPVMRMRMVAVLKPSFWKCNEPMDIIYRFFSPPPLHLHKRTLKTVLNWERGQEKCKIYLKALLPFIF